MPCSTLFWMLKNYIYFTNRNIKKGYISGQQHQKESFAWSVWMFLSSPTLSEQPSCNCNYLSRGSWVHKTYQCCGVRWGSCQQSFSQCRLISESANITVPLSRRRANFRHQIRSKLHFTRHFYSYFLQIV